ncbi:MAG: PadR family transcriptional regulator, partial [Staphylococcus epidermidis]|nr:PadR family transcriptional regulator [Staphylococcus epidermidis]
VKSGELSTYYQPSTEGPSRKYYQLTQQGAARVDQLEEEWKLFTEAVEHFIEESENE